jgi:hypothetical protein
VAFCGRPPFENKIRLMNNPTLDSIRRQNELYGNVWNNPTFDSIRRQKELYGNVWKNPTLDSIRRQNELYGNVWNNPTLDSIRRQNEQLFKVGIVLFPMWQFVDNFKDFIRNLRTEWMQNKCKKIDEILDYCKLIIEEETKIKPNNRKFLIYIYKKYYTQIDILLMMSDDEIEKEVYLFCMSEKKRISEKFKALDNVTKEKVTRYSTDENYKKYTQMYCGQILNFKRTHEKAIINVINSVRASQNKPKNEKQFSERTLRRAIISNRKILDNYKIKFPYN